MSKTTSPTCSRRSRTSTRQIFPLSARQDLNKEHGRLEQRTIEVSTTLNDYIKDLLRFPYVAQVFRLTRYREDAKTGKISTEIAYGITSLLPEKASPTRLLTLNRRHWGIENRLHWVRDVTFDEDRSTVRTKNGPRVMASLRNFVISLLRLLGAKYLPCKLRELAARPHIAMRYLRL